VTEKLIRPDELPQWVPGALTVTTPESGWDGVSVRGYRYTESDVGVPPMRDYLIVAYRHGITRMDREIHGGWKHEDLGPGDVSLLTRAAESHWHWPEDIEVVHVYLTGDRLAQICADVYGRDVASVELRDVLKAADPDLYRTAMLIADEAKQGGLGGRCYVDALTCQLAIQILRRHADATFPELPIGGRLSAREIRTVTEFIDAHLDEQLSLAELAQTVSLSQYHFARCFREATGTTPHRFVTERRVERAERLLTSSALPISVVANACGVLGSESPDARVPTIVRCNAACRPIACIVVVDARAEDVVPAIGHAT
jgi:AraC family transcriptional regulator